MTTHRINAHRSTKGTVLSDGDHNNYYTGSRYAWRVLLRGRTAMPDDHQRDVERQRAGRDGIPFANFANAVILRRGYIQS